MTRKDIVNPNSNLFSVLRAGFPASLDEVAVETENGLRYSWRDLERASAMLANLFASLNLPTGARIALAIDYDPSSEAELHPMTIIQNARTSGGGARRPVLLVGKSMATMLSSAS